MKNESKPTEYEILGVATFPIHSLTIKDIKWGFELSDIQICDTFQKNNNTNMINNICDNLDEDSKSLLRCSFIASLTEWHEVNLKKN